MLSFAAWLSSATLVVKACTSATELLGPSKSSEDYVKYFPTSSERTHNLTKGGILLRAAAIQSLSGKILCIMTVSAFQTTKSQ